MVKGLIVCFVGVLSSYKSHPGESGVKPLGILVTDFIFRADMWPKFKERLHQKLSRNEMAPDALKVAGKTFDGTDLSGVCWKGVNFRDCQFIGVHLEGSDLRDVDLEGAVFNLDRSSLEGVILYCLLDDQGEADLGSAFRFDSSLSDLDLVRLYARLMRKSRRAKKNAFRDPERSKELLKESKRYGEEAQGLNRLLGPLRLNLEGANLKHIKLDGICLRGATLEEANLNGSKINNADFRGVNLRYGYCDRARLRTINFRNADLGHRYLYKSTLEGVDFRGANVCGTFFKKAHLKKVDFRGAMARGHFGQAVLEDVDFENAHVRTGTFEGAHLKRVNFQGADIYAVGLGKVYKSTEINTTCFSKVNLRKALFRDFKISEKIYFPNYDHLNELFDLWDKSQGRVKEDYHDYIKSHLKLFKGVPYEKLKRALSQEKNLINANLKKLDLHNVDFRNCYLSGASLDKSDLSGSDLRGAQLTLVSLIGTNLEGVILSDSLTLPPDCSDLKLVEIYHSCRDYKDKRILRKVLKGKKLFGLIKHSQTPNQESE